VAKISLSLPPTVVLQHARPVQHAREQSPETACPNSPEALACLQHSIHIVSHVNTYFLDCFMRGFASLGHIFKIHL
jgi:hypothetical protein